MDGISHRNVCLVIITTKPETLQISLRVFPRTAAAATATAGSSRNGNELTCSDLIAKCYYYKLSSEVSSKDFINKETLIVRLFALILSNLKNISMLKRSHSMDFDSGRYKPSATPSSDNSLAANSVDNDETTQSSKKVCNSPERSALEDGKSTTEGDSSPETSRNLHGRSDSYRRYSQSGENAHVTQSRSIFSHEDGFVYGNPKEEIKNIENPSASETAPEMVPFDNSTTANVLDLSCKSSNSNNNSSSSKTEEGRSSVPPVDGNTYQNYQSRGFTNEAPFSRSNLEIKLVNPPNKKPTIPEQLQIAKIQQQQRRSIQQQQKILQQMRRSLDFPSKSSNRSHHSNNMEASQGSHNKNVKYYGNNTSNHEHNDVDNQTRMKEEYQPPIPSSHFPPQTQYPFFDPANPKELPDGHPILPLLDPMYFSALYNAHGFLPPSSPSIAAAFIGTLQDALPKLPMMFPSTSSNNPTFLPQKSNENPN